MHNPTATQQVKPRRRMFAALMSTALPGLGQLYNGEFNKAIWIFLLFSITAIPLVMIIALLLPAGLTMPLVALSTLITIGIWLYAIIDGWRMAAKLQHFHPQVWQTSGVYALVFLICATVILPSTLLWVRKHQVEPFYIPSGSMEPSLLRGDYIFANKSYNCPNCRNSVKRGDVALFVYPDNRTQHYVKRVIGLPGDIVTINGTKLTVNGKALSTGDQTGTEHIDDKTWQVQWSEQPDKRPYEITVQPGHAFVLGDNRSNSNDSRVFGQVPLSDIVGRVRQVWFSKSAEGIRWSRIGQLIN